ncbi:MAG: apolipoprotein N-acyltransferase [Victivallaceae bacterium]|nr:apolipoprotein N-acyltransferase [Victivallaceae bacterium]
MGKEDTKLKFSDALRKAERAGNEAFRISWRRRGIELLALVFGGILTSIAVPDLNWSVAIWFCIIPLYWIIRFKSPFKAWLCGYIWGLAALFTGFFWLREIQPAIPFMIAPILAVLPACWSMLAAFLHRNLLYPAATQLRGFDAVNSYLPAPWKEFILALVLAALWCLSEWAKAWLLPWNFLSASQWQNLPLIQICSYTGTYGVSFLIVMVNITFAMAFINGLKPVPKAIPHARFRRPLPFIIMMFVMMAVIMFGSNKLRRSRVPAKAQVQFSPALIQGDISQRRQASNAEAQEALDIYTKMSKAVIPRKPDIIIWPETAVAYPYRGSGIVCRDYRFQLFSMIRDSGIPFLIGTIDFEDLPAGTTRTPGVTNAALFLGKSGEPVAKYEKIQRVPFGEYVPFRQYLPEWLVEMADMGRDLTPGKSFTPLQLAPGVKAGMAICFESVFDYIAREEARRGANLLLVISNDAWYPTSSEPAQHLANAVFRTIETGLPMLRVGNNSASCLIRPNGEITDSLMNKKLPNGKTVVAPEVRGRASGIFTIMLELEPELTFYTRFGNLFIALCWALSVAGTIIAGLVWYRKKAQLLKVTGKVTE